MTLVSNRLPAGVWGCGRGEVGAGIIGDKIPLEPNVIFVKIVLAFLKAVCYNVKLKCNARSSGSYDIARM